MANGTGEAGGERSNFLLMMFRGMWSEQGRQAHGKQSDKLIGFVMAHEKQLIPDAMSEVVSRAKFS